MKIVAEMAIFRLLSHLKESTQSSELMKNYRKTIKIVYKYKWIHYKVYLKNLYAGIKCITKLTRSQF